MTQTRRISGVATEVFKDKLDTVVKLYDTEVVRWDSKRILLNTGGFFTATTKRRMNQTSNEFNLGFNVYTHKGDWMISFKGETFFFEDSEATLLR
jgi:hypothetical protein